MKTHPRVLIALSISVFAIALLNRSGSPVIHHPQSPPPQAEKVAAPTEPHIIVSDSNDALPKWAVGFGKEFWRRSAPATPSQPGTAQLPASINLGDIMDRVTFAFRNEGNTVSVQAPTYRAQVDHAGIHFAPFRPAESEENGPPASDGVSARLRTKEIRTSAERTGVAGSGNSGPVVAGNTAQQLVSAEYGIVEHFESSREGLAVSWIVPRQPGSGDLTIGFEVGGLTYADESAQGHHFADALGTARLRVGHATLVDASGAKTELHTRCEAGALEITVAADLLARAQYPIAIDPVVMPEFGIDNYDVQSPQNEFGPAAAHNSDQYLVVWHNSTNIFGARISEAGQLLDFGGIPICTNGFTRRFSRVAATPTGYLVVWTDFRDTPTTGTDIYGARVTTSGAVLDPNGIAISTTTGLEDLPDLANNGNESLVVWQSNAHVFGARVRGDGVVLDPGGVQLSPATGGQGQAAVACNGSDYLVVWQHVPNSQSTSDIRGARVSLANVPGADFAISAATNGEFTPAVASIGSNYFVVWEDNRIGPDPDVFGALVTAAGVGAAVEVSRVVGGQFAPAIAANANNYFVTWQDSRFFTSQRFDIYGARVDANGTVIDPGGFQITTSANRETAPCVAAGAGNFLVAWEDTVSQADIRATFVSVAGIVGDHTGMVLTHNFPPQFSPRIAFNGTEFLVAWMDYRLATTFETNVVFGARLTPDGQLIGSSGLLISRAASYKQAIALAGNATEFLVTWEDRRVDNFTGDIFGCRVAGGVVLDTNGIPIATAAGHQTSPNVATDGTGFMVVWNSGGVIMGSRVTQAGSVTDAPGVPIAAGDSPDVAFGGGNYFVVWQDNQPQPHIRGARVNNGSILDPSGIPINSFASSLQRLPRVAFNGTHFLVVWQDDRSPSTTQADIFSTLVDTAGTVLNPAGANLTGPGFQRAPSVATSGNDFLVIWHDYLNASSSGIDLAGGRARAGTGQAMDGMGFTIDAGPGDQNSFAVAYAGNGNYLVAYETRVQGVRRVVGRFVSGPPPGNPIPGLFNTGVDSLRRVLSDNTPDPHYTIVAGPITGTAFTTTSAQGFPIPPWVGDNSISGWISPTTDTSGPGGSTANYAFETTFDLTGYDPATAIIVGQWSTDNIGPDILINGQSTGHANTAQFVSFTPFRISSGFINGINRLRFVVNNADGPGNNPTGLRVEMEGTIGVLSSPVMHKVEWQKDTVIITWEGRRDWSYIVQYTDNIATRRWNEFPDVVRPEGEIATFTDKSPARDLRFYRVLRRE